MDPASDLAAARRTIDEIDAELVRLINRRATAARDVGRAKASAGTGEGSAIFVPHREKEVLDRVTALSAGPMPAPSLHAIWREIMSASFALERPLAICHFGQPGAFTHLAARLKFGGSVSYLAVDDIGAVFTEVEKRRADYGVVPIENSTDGSITDTIDAFLATHLRIVSELHLRVRHHLMARCGRAAIKRIYSRNTVFAQCRRWLAANLPGIELIDVVSTTKAAERAASEPEAAALGSEDAAAAYGLPVLAADVQDNPNNITRFVVIALPALAAKPTGNDKTALMFGVQNRPGALYDCLLPFHRRGISLCRIESRPSRRRPWEYLFFIDFEGHQDDAPVSAALKELAASTSTLEVLGSFPRAEMPLNE